MKKGLLFLLAFLFLAPLLWMVNASLKPEGMAIQEPLTPSMDPEFGNYVEALTRMGAFDQEKPLRGFLRIALNTVVLTAFSIVFQVLTCSLAGFAFAKLRFRGRDFLFILVLATMMLPLQVTVIPQFVLFRGLGWIDTFLPLLAPCLFGGSPFFIFLFRQYFLTLPRDVIDAAKLDGAGWFTLYFRVLLPLSRPVVATVSVFTFLFVWNDLWMPLIYLSSPENGTLTLALAGFSRTYRVSVELLMAASTVVLFPCLIIYFIAQKYFVTGVRLTAGKG